MGPLLLLSVVVVVAMGLAAALLRALRLPDQYIAFVAVALIAVGVYAYLVIDAHERPSSLWKRSWEQDSEAPDQRQLARYRSREECLKAQEAKLDEEFEQRKQAHGTLKRFRENLNQQSVYLREGRTIFELGPSMLSRLMEYSAKKRGLTEDQKGLAFDLLALPEVKATVSVFCAPSVKYRLFPFYAPAYPVAADDLRAMGERALRVRAKEALGK